MPLIRDADGILLFDAFPRAGHPLLEAQGDLLLLVVDVQDLHLDFLVDRRPFPTGWLMRPQLMSVMCSRPSMPPRSTNAPNSAMFLTMPLRRWPDFQLGQQLGLLLGPLGLDQRPAADDDVPPRLVDLQHEALDRPADVIADVGRAADVDLAGRQEHVHADVDQQPALDLPRGHAGDDVALVDRLHHLQPGLDLFGLALAERDHAAGVVHQAVDVFHVLDQHLDPRARLGQRSPSSHSLRKMMPSLL